VYLLANDANAGASNSESFFMTVKSAGIYAVQVGVASGGTNVGPYRLGISVLPASTSPATTYASADIPKAIVDTGTVVSVLSIPDNRRIGRLAVNLRLNHSAPADLDLTLTAPDGNTVALVSDVGSNTQTNWNFGLRDDAAIPAGVFTVLDGAVFRTELATALDWFRGQNAQGTWTLTIRDDAALDTGTLLGWSLVIADPPPGPAGPTTTVFSTTFEANDGGFTHSGTADEWEWGTPVFAPITNSHSGTRCWVTDLDNTYEVSASADLFSPDIDLAAYRSSVPVFLRWAMKHHLESASFDHAYVEVQEVGGGGASRKVWEWMGATQNATIGNPPIAVPEAAGWGLHQAIISDFAGKTIRVRFHLDSDTTVQLGGLAIDDVSVTVHPGILRSGDDVLMNFMGLPGRPYRIQRSTNLLAGAWSDVVPPAPVIAPESAAFPYTSTNPSPRMMLYRLAPDP
jgi:subtilisin-like proprotein convertase family protein